MFRFPGLLLSGAAFVALATVVPATATASHGAHAPAPCCASAPDCCPPPPVKVELCVEDPCTCCTYNVTVCIPACCADEAPCVAGWRKGLFGRKIVTYTWPCCGHSVDVVITRHGRTIVRG